MADSISSVPVLTNDIDQFKARWGSTVFDYQLNGVTTDFQDLMVAISQHRATAVEGEVQPLATRMRRRNNDLQQLGSLLSIFTQTQAGYDSNASGSTNGSVSGIKTEMLDMACEAYARKGGNAPRDLRWWNRTTWTKASVDGMVSVLKSMIDERNNAAQTDMTRLQSLVDSRDESFTTATTLMTSVSETRDNAIRNL